MKKFKLTDDRFNRDYGLLSLNWIVIGVADLLVLELPRLAAEQSLATVLGAAAAVICLAGGVLMLCGRRLGPVLVVLALAVLSLKLYITDGWAGFKWDILVTLLMCAVLLTVTLRQKKDGHTAWEMMK